MTGVLLILVGLAGITFGFVAGKFYAAFIRRPKATGKPLPTRLGRAVFFIVGAWFVYAGLSDLVFH